MSVASLGQSSRLPPASSVELAGARQWMRSLLVMPGLFVIVVVVCGLAGATDWALILTVMSALTVVFEALLVRNGATSLVVSPGAVVRRNRQRTTMVRAEDVHDILIKHLVNGPVMIISAGPSKIGLPLPAVYRKPMARDVLASFLRRAGVDLSSLRGLGLPAPVVAPRTVAGPILSRPAWPASGSPGSGSRQEAGPPANSAGGALGPGDGQAEGRWPSRPSVRVGGRALTWVTLAALALTAAIGLLRVFS
jgi:hypothetical protein